MNDYGLNNDKRNYLLDFFKGVAAISVVLGHFRFPGITGKIMTSVGTAGVVLFFLIGGYFAYSEDNEAACGKIIERFKRNLVITLIAVLVYFVFTAVREALIGNIAAWAAKFTNPVLYLRMIVMGDFEVINSDPLWFMPALLYSYLILWCIHKFRIKKVAYIALPFLLLLRIGMETYTNSFGADWHMSGNFLVGGLPVMLLGHFIAHKKEAFMSRSVKIMSAECIISVLLMFISVNILIAGMDISQMFKIWSGFSVFILALKLPQKKVLVPVGVIGYRYSLHVYLWHFLIGITLGDILNAAKATTWTVDWCLPVATIIVSIAVSAVIYRINNIRTK
ncbi:acyltransferase family protein [Butyrivibrio sp. JL13D10]|uniref:acyltransferase family protein n=1 Tax=Butyrivibrio sp. JL13D10 TaxID=3236815 RepID=UPI0038B67E01